MSSISNDSAGNGSTTRRKILTAMIAVLVIAGVIYGVWYKLVASHYESTDDAYVQGNVVQITTQVAGTVVAIKADDTDYVKAGQDLVLLDKADAQVALDQAEAQLAQTVREVRTVYANNATLSATIAAKETDVATARSELQRATDDYKRREALVATGAVSGEEMQHVQTALADAKSRVAAAEANLVASREQLASNQSLTEGTTVAHHPNVERAGARVREAYLALARTTVPAPVDGQLAKRSVQLGQRVQPGAPLMAIVPLNHLWVDANFKEVQLRNMRIGQTVALESDVYGSHATYHGKVIGLSAGTGSAFSLLPAQNATGNWIKVVQRVAVRIELDDKELAANPLRIGLSMVVKVDTKNQDLPQLSSAARSDDGFHTSAFDTQFANADAMVKTIIDANLGTAPAQADAAKPGSAAKLDASVTTKPSKHHKHRDQNAA
jgi:membrane fusion protein, multidrug efflux system